MVFGGGDGKRDRDGRDRDGREAKEGREPEGEGGFIPDMVRRAVERSIQAILHSDEGRRNLVGALLPRELIHGVMQQIDGTKKEAVAMIGREMQQFLQSLDVGGELRKILTSVTFEIKTEVRFVPNESGGLRPEVKASSRPRVNKAAQGKGKGKKKGARSGKSTADAAFSTVQAAAEGTRRRVQRVVDKLAEKTGDLTGQTTGGGKSSDE